MGSKAVDHTISEAEGRAASGLTVLTAAGVALMSVAAGDRDLWYLFVTSAWATAGLVFLLWRKDALSTRQILIGGVCFRLLLFWLPPDLSDDAFRYVWDGLMQAEGINPFLYRPADSFLVPFHDEPVFPELNSEAFYSVYPPVSQLIFRLGAFAYPLGWSFSYYVIKGLLLMMEVAALLLLGRMAAPRMLLLYAWNPLVILEVGGQAHTESAMVLFLVLALWCSRQGWGGWAAAALALAGWVKLYPLVLLPFLLRDFAWRRIVAGAILASVAVWLPYFDLRVPARLAESLNLYVRYFEFNAGLYYGIKGVFKLFTGEDWSKSLGPFLRMVFLFAVAGLYGLHWKARWSLRKAFVLTIGALLLLSTTVHPWYFVGLLAVLTLAPRPSWHWLAVGVLSIGTYLLYIEGPYWSVVVLAWGAWLVLAWRRYEYPLLQWIQQQRAQRKVKVVAALLPEDAHLERILDLGAGEGYVGLALQHRYATRVVLADVVPMNRTSLELVLYDGETLPFPSGHFDLVVLYFVLHHCKDQLRVLREALRVSRGYVLVVESVYRSERERRILHGLDAWANRVRSGGLMRSQEEHVQFRTLQAWRTFFTAAGRPSLAERRWGRRPHRQAAFLLDAS